MQEVTLYRQMRHDGVLHWGIDAGDDAINEYDETLGPVEEPDPVLDWWVDLSLAGLPATVTAAEAVEHFAEHLSLVQAILAEAAEDACVGVAPIPAPLRREARVSPGLRLELVGAANRRAYGLGFPDTLRRYADGLPETIERLRSVASQTASPSLQSL